MSPEMSIAGLQEAQNANLEKIRALRSNGPLGDAIKGGTIMLQQSAVIKTHVVTGSLRASHRIAVNGLRGQVYIDLDAVNPRTRSKPSEYGVIEHARGGEHAFYARAIDEDGMRIKKAIAEEFLRGLPKK